MEDEQKLYKKSYILSDKNRYYNILIQSNLNSQINITAIEQIYQKKYFESYSLYKLKNIKYLSSLDTINDIFVEIKDKIEKSKPNIYEEKNSLKLVIATDHTKFKEIIFNLNEKEKDINDKLYELNIEMNKLREKEKKQDEKIQILEEKIEELIDNNIKLFNQNKKLEKTIKEIKKYLNYNNIKYRLRNKRRYKNRYIYHRTLYRPKQVNSSPKVNKSSYSINNNNEKVKDIPISYNNISYQEENNNIKEEKREDSFVIKEGKFNNKAKSIKKSKLAMLFDELDEENKKYHREKKNQNGQFFLMKWMKEKRKEIIFKLKQKKNQIYLLKKLVQKIIIIYKEILKIKNNNLRIKVII